MRSKVGLVVVGVILVACGIVWAAEPPVAVSPGSATGTVVEGRCPTFIWGAMAGAQSYELVVYRAEDGSEEEKPVWRQELPGSAPGWTPSLDRCLDRGNQYAWSVRAIGRKEASEWSSPSLFEVASGPSDAEFEAALEIVQQYIAGAGLEVSPNNGGFASGEAQAPRSGSVGPQSVGTPAPLTPVAGDSTLQVNGSAVVTVATFGAALCNTTEERYRDQGDGTVMDCSTGLVWLKDASCLGEGIWDNTFPLDTGSAQWKVLQLNAGTNPNPCKDYANGSHADWVLPTVSEFCSHWVGENLTPCPPEAAPDSLMDSSVGPPMVVNAMGDGVWTPDDAFFGVESGNYWSDTPGTVNDVWFVSLGSGNVIDGDSNAPHWVWPVRAGQ